MNVRFEHEPLYILHRRSYQESSFLLECFSEQHGRLSILAKGARRRKIQISAILQPFVPLLMSWSGARELKNMVDVELKRRPFFLNGDALFFGFYLNELIIKLTARFDPHPLLFSAYEAALEKLVVSADESALRVFEKACFQHIGYGLFSAEDEFDAEQNYQFIFDQGFIQTNSLQGSAYSIFKGDHLTQFLKENWRDREALLSAKRLVRLVLAHLLAGQELNSRSLYVNEKNST